MAAVKRRRRVAPLSGTERVLIVLIVGVAAWLAYDVYRRWHPTPAVGGLALRVFSPRGAGGAPRAIPSPLRPVNKVAGARAAPRPQPPPENPYARQPTTYTPPSASPSAAGRGAGAHTAGPASQAGVDAPLRLRFPSFGDEGREGGSVDPVSSP